MTVAGASIPPSSPSTAPSLSMGLASLHHRDVCLTSIVEMNIMFSKGFFLVFKSMNLNSRVKREGFCELNGLIPLSNGGVLIQ